MIGKLRNINHPRREDDLVDKDYLGKFCYSTKYRDCPDGCRAKSAKMRKSIEIRGNLLSLDTWLSLPLNI